MAILRVWVVESAFVRIIWPIRLRRTSHEIRMEITTFTCSCRQIIDDGPTDFSLALTLTLFPSDDPEIWSVCKSKWNFKLKSDRPPPFHRRPSVAVFRRAVYSFILFKKWSSRNVGWSIHAHSFLSIRMLRVLCSKTIRYVSTIFDGISGIEGDCSRLRGAFFSATDADLNFSLRSNSHDNRIKIQQNFTGFVPKMTL